MSTTVGLGGGVASTWYFGVLADFEWLHTLISVQTNPTANLPPTKRTETRRSKAKRKMMCCFHTGFKTEHWKNTYIRSALLDSLFSDGSALFLMTLQKQKHENLPPLWIHVLISCSISHSFEASRCSSTDHWAGATAGPTKWETSEICTIFSQQQKESIDQPW